MAVLAKATVHFNPMSIDACHYELARCGHRGMLVWVLADNSARRFYERLGGEPAGESSVTIAGARLREVAYAWRD